MEIVFHKKFKKKLSRLPVKIQNKFHERLHLFVEDMNHTILNNHSVEKVFAGCRSINVTGDYRAIFRREGQRFTFLRIGTHSELY